MACKDMLCRAQYVTTTVDCIRGRVTIKVRGCDTTIVLRPKDVGRLRQQLADALAVLIQITGSWPAEDE